MRTGAPGLRPATSWNAALYSTFGSQSCLVVPMRKMAAITRASPAMTKMPTLTCLDMVCA